VWFRRIERKIDLLIDMLKIQGRREVIMMATIDEGLDQMNTDVEANTTVVGSLATLTASLFKMFQDALAGTLTPAQEAKLAVVKTKLEANNQLAADAFVANTPIAPA
jgi:hypothetical protein